MDPPAIAPDPQRYRAAKRGCWDAAGALALALMIRRHFGLSSTLASVILLGSVAACSHATPVTKADALVEQLRGLPPYINPGPFSMLCARQPCPPFPVPPIELKRRRILRQLFALGNASVQALARALNSSDLNMKLNAELALQQLGFGWWDGLKPKLDITSALPALMGILNDPNPKVRWSAEFDIAAIGPRAGNAGPKLIALLGSSDEGTRGNACIALGHIGMAASNALPALQARVSDPSAWVRKVAHLAIARIEGKQPSLAVD